MPIKNAHLFVAVMIAVMALAAAVPAAHAGGCRAPCPPTCAAVGTCCPPTVQYVQKTIMVPSWEIEQRKIKTVKYVPKTCTRMVTVYKRVTETKEVPCQYTEMVPKKCTKTVNYTTCVPVTKMVEKTCSYCVPVTEQVQKQVPVCVPEMTEVEKKYVVNVPAQETREGVRQVCRCVPEKQTRTVCKDKGHWEERPAPACAPECCEPACAAAKTAKTCKVWVPNIVQEEIEETVMKRKIVQEPCKYNVTVCKPEVRTKKVKQCNYKTEMKTVTCNVRKLVRQTSTRKVPVTTYVAKPQTKQVSYTVCVPVTKTTTKTVCNVKCVPQQVQQTYTVMVPVPVEQVVPVRVCKMVPRTITVPVCCRPQPCTPKACAPADCGSN